MKGRVAAERLMRGVARRVTNLRLIDRRKAFELWEVSSLRELFRLYNVDCVFDVGANTGQYGSLIRNKLGFKGHLISFEPQPEARHALERRAAGDSLWRVESTALSDANGTATFNVMFGSEFSSLSTPLASTESKFQGAAATKRTIEVKTETLGSALKRLKKELGFERPFIKLDTQGYDHNILMNDRDATRQFVGLQSELAVSRLYEHSVDYLTALGDYQRLGFSPCSFVPNNFGHFPHLYELDCIMIRSDLLKTSDPSV